MNPIDRLRRFERVIEDLREAAKSSPIIVEGPRDAAALVTLGVHTNVHVYNQGVRMVDFVDQFRDHDRIVVLFDWDRKGGQLTRLFKNQLGGHSRLDLTLRGQFTRLSPLKCVEELPTAYRILQERAGVRPPRP